MEGHPAEKPGAPDRVPRCRPRAGHRVNPSSKVTGPLLPTSLGYIRSVGQRVLALETCCGVWYGSAPLMSELGQSFPLCRNQHTPGTAVAPAVLFNQKRK